MRFNVRHLLSIAVLGLAVGVSGCGTTGDTRTGTTETVRAAQATLNNFQNDPEMRWFRENLGKARAVIISPRVTRAGFVFGGSGGEALVLARDSATGGWAGPAFYNMGAGSVGFQFGVDVSEMIVLVMSEKALDSLMSSSLNLGADVSVAAGPVGMGAATNVQADMVSFARSRGAYAGLNIEGAVISPDPNANQAFYGTPATPADILVRRTVDNPAALPLQQSLSRTPTR